MSDKAIEEQLKLARDECERLRTENTRLRSLIESEGKPQAGEMPFSDSRSVKEKISLFRSLFKGREDVYALRWESNLASSR